MVSCNLNASWLAGCHKLRTMLMLLIDRYQLQNRQRAVERWPGGWRAQYSLDVNATLIANIPELIRWNVHEQGTELWQHEHGRRNACQRSRDKRRASKWTTHEGCERRPCARAELLTSRLRRMSVCTRRVPRSGATRVQARPTLRDLHSAARKPRSPTSHSRHGVNSSPDPQNHPHF
eukprot:568834-Prymnesium_polylepis.1